jgi:hypothetical protein
MRKYESAILMLAVTAILGYAIFWAFGYVSRHKAQTQPAPALQASALPAQEPQAATQVIVPTVQPAVNPEPTAAKTDEKDGRGYMANMPDAPDATPEAPYSGENRKTWGIARELTHKR